MRNIFKDSTLQKDFERKGYVEIPALVSSDIAGLHELFVQHTDEYAQPFHTSHFSAEINYKRRVHEAIVNIVFPRLAAVLENVKPIFGNLMIKHGMNDYFMPLHADWTYVEESKFRSLAAWIPLINTDQENGCLGVIEGSHKLSDKIRGPRIQQTSYTHDKVWVEKYGTLIPVKAGHAILFDHALMHYSPPNRTAGSRPALNLSMVPAEADLFHYCIPEGASDIEEYHVDNSEFYLRYNNYQRPETNSLIRTLPADTVKWVDSKMESFNPYKKKGILGQLVDYYHRLK
jgi:hypothetical protein